MNGWLPYQSLCLQSQVVPWSLTVPAALVGLVNKQPFPIHTQRHSKNTDAQLHTDNTVQDVQFRNDMHMSKNDAPVVAARNSAEPKHTHSLLQGTQACTHVS